MGAFNDQFSHGSLYLIILGDRVKAKQVTFIFLLKKTQLHKRINGSVVALDTVLGSNDKRPQTRGELISFVKRYC